MGAQTLHEYLEKEASIVINCLPFLLSLLCIARTDQEFTNYNLTLQISISSSCYKYEIDYDCNNCNDSIHNSARFERENSAGSVKGRKNDLN